MARRPLGLLPPQPGRRRISAGGCAMQHLFINFDSFYRLLYKG